MSVAILGLSHSIWISLPDMVLFGIFPGMYMTVFLATLQATVPNELLGRVLAADEVGSYAMVPFGQYFGGSSPSHSAQPRPRFLIAGVGTIAVGLLTPTFRKLPGTSGSSRTGRGPRARPSRRYRRPGSGARSCPSSVLPRRRYLRPGLRTSGPRRGPMRSNTLARTLGFLGGIPHPAGLGRDVLFRACAFSPPSTARSGRGSGTPEFDLFMKEVVREMTVKAGQKCTAIRRALVPAAQIDAVEAALKDALGKIVVGDPRDEKTRRWAPSSAIAQRDDVREKIETLSKEARIVFGDPNKDEGKGAFLSPVLLRCDEPGESRTRA